MIRNLLVAVLLAVPTCSAATTLVDLQRLVDGAAAGDTLYLDSARYAGATLRRPLTIVGGGAVIDGGGKGHTLEILAPDVHISDLSVIDSGTDVTFKESGIWVAAVAADVVITRVRVENCGFGIWIDGASRPRIIRNVVVGRSDDPIISNLGNGIHLFKVTDGLVAENEITRGRDGIYISNSTGCVIRANRIFNTRFAIHYMYSHSNDVIANQTDSSSVGLALMYSKHLRIFNNSMSNSSTLGLLLRNLYYSRITNNEADHNKQGVSFSGCNYDTLVANRVHHNEIGVLVSDSKDNLVVNNAFSYNAQQMSYQDNVDMQWGDGKLGNYWSDYLGWDRDGDGIGDKRHYPATITSFLVYRFPVVKLIMHSPAMVLLQSLEEKFPVMRPPGVVEEHPLMKDPTAVDMPAIAYRKKHGDG